jgi:uncharacterized protein (TIGR02001 family)
VLRIVVAVGALLAAGGVHAQVSGNVTWTSDYRFRGVSLSDDAPALQVSLAYDGSGGWYAGAFASSVRRPLGVDASAQLVTYAGYARRIRPGLSWEVGTEYVMLLGASEYDYPEFYIGLASERLSGRLYYAPRYFNEGAPVVYAEINGTQPLSRRLRLLGHVGGLRRDRDADDEGARTRFDAQLGLGIALEPFDLRIARVAVSDRRNAERYPVDGADRNGWLLALSRSW